MKKKFKETKFGKILTGKIGRALIEGIPLGIGSMALNVLDDNGTEPGRIDKATALPKLVKLLFYAVLAYLVVSGKLSEEGANVFKNVLE